MCLCGGVLEVGVICGVVGLVIKKIKNCRCHCHSVKDECEHCDNSCHTCNEIDEKHHHSIKEIAHKSKHNWLTILATILILFSFVTIGYTVYKYHKHFNCEHNHHIEMEK